MDRYYVFPREGEWVARKGDSGDELGSFSTRGEALEAARDDRGDVREDIYRKEDDGSFGRVGVLVKHRGPEALWLLREDGSVYGEVDHEIAPGGGQPIIMNIAPANAGSEAQSVGDEE